MNLKKKEIKMNIDTSLIDKEILLFQILMKVINFLLFIIYT